MTETKVVITAVFSLDKVSVELEKLHQLLVQMRLEDVTGKSDRSV